MRKFDVPTPDSVRAALKTSSNARDLFRLYDAPSEMAEDFKARASRYNHRATEWTGGASGKDAYNMAISGDLANVAKSDALLAKFEQYVMDTNRKGWQDDVCGGVPNVPAFIAGHPLNMRRRVTYRDHAAPVAVIVDLTTSARFSAEQIMRRGVAILALVRALSQRRPVELWAGVMLDATRGRDCVNIFARIETAPLDIATAGYCLTHPAFPRLIGYGLADLDKYQGQWPYNKAATHRDHMAAILTAGFTHATETLCIPSMYGADDSFDNPEQWVAMQLEKLAPVNLNDAA